MKNGILIIALLLTYSSCYVLDSRDSIVSDPLKCPIEYNQEFMMIDGVNVFTLKSGNETVLMKYDFTGNFSEGLARVRINDKWGFIDKTGEIIIKPQFDEIPGNFSEGLARVNIKGNWGFIWGFIDKTGEIIIKPQFYDAFDFNEGLASVKINGQYGSIDKTGKVIIKPRFNDAYHFSEGLASVQIGGKAGYIDKTGRIVIKPQFYQAYDFNEGLAWAWWTEKDTSKIGFIDKKGKFVFDAKKTLDNSYHSSYFSEGLALVKFGQRYHRDSKSMYYNAAFIDNKGKFVSNTVSDVSSVSQLREGLAKINYGYYNSGFIDKTGRIIIEPQFEDASDFSEGLAKISIHGKYGFIDKTGRIVIKPQFDKASDFREGLATVGIAPDKYSREKWGFIKLPTCE